MFVNQMIEWSQWARKRYVLTYYLEFLAFMIPQQYYKNIKQIKSLKKNILSNKKKDPTKNWPGLSEN